MKKVVSAIIPMLVAVPSFAGLIAAAGSGTAGTDFVALKSSPAFSISMQDSNGNSSTNNPDVAAGKTAPLSVPQNSLNALLDGNLWDKNGINYITFTNAGGTSSTHAYSVITIDFGAKVTISQFVAYWRQANLTTTAPALELYADSLANPAFATFAGKASEKPNFWAGGDEYKQDTGLLATPVSMNKLLIKLTAGSWASTAGSEFVVTGATAVPETQAVAMLGFGSVALLARKSKP